MKKYKVSGLSCTSCETSLQTALSKLESTQKALVNLSDASLYLETTNFQEAQSVAQKLGFKIIDNQPPTKTNNNFILLVCLGIILFMVAMFPMFNLPLLPIIDPHHNWFNYSTLQLILASMILWLCIDLMLVGFKKLIKRIPNMDSLIFLSVSSAYLYSLFLYLTNKQHVMLYFESGGMILVFVSVGKYFDAKSKQKSLSALHALLELTPKTATLKNGEVKLVDEIQVNDIICVKAGMIVPLDGKILLGSSFIDEKLLTGESIPVEKTVNDKLFAGTMNTSGYLEYVVTKSNQDSVLAEIIRLVEYAQLQKAPIAKVVDIIASYFVWGMIFLSLCVFLIWSLLFQNLNLAFQYTITMLVIACPCALGLATPIAILTGSTRANQLHVLFKNGEAIQQLNNIDYVVFDKTGTLTTSEVKIVSEYLMDDEAKNLIASIEKASSHPLAFAFQQNYDANLQVDNVENLTGQGLKATIDKEVYYVGNLKLIQSLNIDITPYQEKINTIINNGESLVVLATSQKILAFFGLTDTLNPDIFSVMNYLKKQHIKTMILSGDHESSVKNIAKKINVDTYYASLDPQAKYQVIQSLKQHYKVLMVGDGINDAIALSDADVSMAIGNGSEIALDSADIILMRNNIYDLILAHRLAKKTMQIIYQNLFWAFFYNSMGILLASGLLSFYGLSLHPMFAAFAMSVSSISVVLNALRLLKYK